jgi:hypothetical protein
METKYSEKDVQMLRQLLQKLNEKKTTRHTPKLHRISEILSVNTRLCTYVGGKNHRENKTHIQVKFLSPDEQGIICVSVLLNKYREN